MPRETAGFAFVCAAAVGIVPLAAAAALTDASRLGPDGVGPIVFGTTPAQAAATGTAFEHGKPAPGSTCYYLRPSAPSGLTLLVEDGNIRRADVVSQAIATTDGFKVGEPVSKLMAFFGARAQTSPDKYDPQVKTITVAPKEGHDARGRTVYKVKHGTISKIIAGLRPQVGYVEGCG